MNCEQATNLISAQLDREIQPEERALLEQHLHGCPSCLATVEAFTLQDQELRQTFEPRRQAVEALVGQVDAALAPPPVPQPAPRRFSYRRLAMTLGGVAAALVAALFLYWRGRLDRPGPGPGDDNDRHLHATAPDKLTPRPRPDEPKPDKLKVGEEVQTKAGRRRRLVLPDDSVLYVNQETSVRLDADRTATLSAGTVFLEVAPQTEEGTTFVVKTPGGEVKALGTKFAVQAEPVGTGVLVTQGKVEAITKSATTTVQAGQRVAAGSDKPSPARASHLLDWTRDLIAASETPLVPGSRYDGGALIAVDASGQQAKLSLRKYHVDVHVEDGFARTTIDQTYFNHHPWRLEGTFYFPLPPDASLSRLAMYVDGNLMEGGMAERDYANAVYQRIVSSQRDPALLEWVDGSTFKMRVFPLEGRQEKRIVLSYTQRLPALYGRTTYRFPAGHNLQTVRDWSFEARVKHGDPLQAASPTHPAMKIERQDGDLVLTDRARNVAIDRDVVVELSNPAGTSPGEMVRFTRADHENNGYLMVRYRPDLPGRLEPQRRDWVFLYETSADRDPLLARTQIEIIRTLLGQVGHDDTFTILTAGTHARFWDRERRSATPENIKAALAYLDGTHLVGALDLGRAFRAAEAVLENANNPHLVHIGSGITAIGTKQDELAKSLPQKIRYVGIGVGKRWGRALMKQAAERTGGYFTQINPDESVGWRAFDLLATLNTPRLLGVQVKANMADGQEAPEFLCDTAAVSQGEEICAITRLGRGAGEPSAPRSVAITGLVDGKSFRRELPVREVATGAGYLPRTWARLEIERLLAADARANKPAIIELSKAMYVMTPYTSLLVLENEAMYKEFKVDRGRKDHWAMYPCPQKIDVVYEPDPSQGIDVRNAPRDRKPTRQEILQTVLVRVPAAFLRRQGQGNNNGTYVSALQRYSRTYAPPELLGDQREELLGRLRGIISKQERVRTQTEGVDHYLDGERRDLYFLQLGDATRRPESRVGHGFGFGNERLGENEILPQVQFDDARRSMSESLGTDWGVDRPEQGRPADRPPVHLPLAFSPDGRLLATGFRGDFDGEGFVSWEMASGRNRVRVWDTTGAPTNRPVLGRNFIVDGSANTVQLLPRLETPSFGFGVSDDEYRAGPLHWSREIEEQIAEAAAFRVAEWRRMSYQRLEFTGDERLCTDLVSYAPGLNSSAADMRAVLEAEAAPELRSAPGSIVPEARRLIDRARQAGWQTLTLSVGKSQPEVRVAFDGSGRYAYEDTLPLGLRERVVCDGKTLLHLYPELGLAARRIVSRFHRAEMASLFPWLPLPAEDLARGADLVAVDAHTVAVVPHPLRSKDEPAEKEKPKVSYRTHLVFAEDGRLAERQLVEVETASDKVKVLAKEVYDGKGLVRVEVNGKERVSHQSQLTPAQQPELKPDLADLVVLDLPLRSRQQVVQGLRLHPEQPLSNGVNGCYRYLPREQALRLLATLAVERSDEAGLVFQHCFQDREDVPRGLFTLLASGGYNVAAEPAFQKWVGRSPNDPLARYLALYGSSSTYRYLQVRVPVNLGTAVGPEGNFLRHLAEFRDLTWRWQRPPFWPAALWARQQDEERSLAFLRRHAGKATAWALLANLSTRGGHTPSRYLKLAQVWGVVAGKEKDYEAGYEQARCLLRAGQTVEARKLFLVLYHQALKKGGLPPIDADFRRALETSGQDNDPWTRLILGTAKTLITEKHRPAVAVLAHQCRQLGDQPLFDNLMRLALADVKDDNDRVRTYLAVIHYLMEANQDGQADQLLQQLLEKKDLASEPSLWRLAVRLADKRGNAGRAVLCLERALDLEYGHLPEVINLESWRKDYRRLLDHYQGLAAALPDLKTEPPDELIRKTVRAADCWRAHDPETATPCQLAGNILKQLGVRELAWDYLTTPLGLRPGEGGSLEGLAVTLSRSGDHDLADHAYATAAEANPDNGMLLWDRAHNLSEWGKTREADALLRQLADDDREAWRDFKPRARWRLKQR